MRYTRAANGRPLVAGKSVTGFSNAEEAAVELTEAAPEVRPDAWACLSTTVASATVDNPAYSRATIPISAELVAVANRIVGARPVRVVEDDPSGPSRPR